MSRRELGRMLRKLANRLDPPQTHVWPINQSATSTANVTSIVWRHPGG